MVEGLKSSKAKVVLMASVADYDWSEQETWDWYEELQDSLEHDIPLIFVDRKTGNKFAATVVGLDVRNEKLKVTLRTEPIH